MMPGSLLRALVAGAAIGAGGLAMGMGVTGCLAASDPNDGAGADPVAAVAQDELQAGHHRTRHGHPPAAGADASVPETGATTGPSAAAICKVCAIASACCEAVGGGPECTFSANMCSALGDAARDSYANRCETFVKNMFAVWKQTPPSECL